MFGLVDASADIVDESGRAEQVPVEKPELVVGLGKIEERGGHAGDAPLVLE
jgi:hypothetical protein